MVWFGAAMVCFYISLLAYLISMDRKLDRIIRSIGYTCGNIEDWGNGFLSHLNYIEKGIEEIKERVGVNTGTNDSGGYHFS